MDSEIATSPSGDAAPGEGGASPGGPKRTRTGALRGTDARFASGKRPTPEGDGRGRGRSSNVRGKTVEMHLCSQTVKDVQDSPESKLQLSASHLFVRAVPKLAGQIQRHVRPFPYEGSRPAERLEDVGEPASGMRDRTMLSSVT